MRVVYQVSDKLQLKENLSAASPALPVQLARSATLPVSERFISTWLTWKI